MEKPIIDVQNIAKLYRVGALGPTTLRETVERLSARWRKGPSPRAPEPSWFGPEQAGPSPNTFWAVKDVSMQVARGEIVGIIGGNGAGKSTLLKILSRITEPTKGRIVLRGRVASLLEVGTGFHAELSGRENIFLNGAILGMKQHEIRRKLDEIVDFAEVGNFIDTPVKRYSSGMYVRLAFAVAAHLEPEILIIDEVLAVGDVQFQKKCLGKMREVSKTNGRTILFVSHNIDAVRRLCSRCVIVDHGRLTAHQDKNTAITEYLSTNGPQARPGEWIDVTHVPRIGTGICRFSAIKYTSLSADAGFQPYPNGPLEVTLAVEAKMDRVVRSIGITLFNQAGTKLINIDSGQRGILTPFHQGRNLVQIKIDHLHLKPGVYVLALWMADFAHPGDEDVLDYAEAAFNLEVFSLDGAGIQGHLNADVDGMIPCNYTLIPEFDLASTSN